MTETGMSAPNLLLAVAATLQFGTKVRLGNARHHPHSGWAVTVPT